MSQMSKTVSDSLLSRLGNRYYFNTFKAEKYCKSEIRLISLVWWISRVVKYLTELDALRNIKNSALFGSTYANIGPIHRRLAWSLRKDERMPAI